MDFFRRAAGSPSKLGILAGTFNPPTRAHLALARAALGLVDEVVFVLPREFPHKTYEQASFAERVEMLEAALADAPRCSIAATAQGLFVDIARECRQAYGPACELYFVCGCDAAERAANWDYGRPGAFREQLREYQLLVAARQGSWQGPPGMRGRIYALALEQDWVSASEVRRRIRSGEEWEQLVPAAVAALARKTYS